MYDIYGAFSPTCGFSNYIIYNQRNDTFLIFLFVAHLKKYILILIFSIFIIIPLELEKKSLNQSRKRYT